MTSLPVASPRAWAMRSRPCPPSRPRASRSPAWSNCVPQSISSPMRCGASRTTRSTTAAIAQRAAGLERVGHVVLEAVVRIEHAGDAALGRSCCSTARMPSLAIDHDRELRIDGQRRPQPGQPAADDQHVGEEVRHALGMERNQVSWRRNGQGKVGHWRCALCVRGSLRYSTGRRGDAEEWMMQGGRPRCYT